MSLFNQLIPNYTLNDKRQIRVAPQMPEPIYIDDAFDPLFNKRAQAYLNAKYGRFLRIPGGYAEMIENMLGNSTKQWGPLGPGMGILGTFGRTIDKAEDFLLGGITEASHFAGNLNPLGSYTPVKNPLREVFVEDNDYNGQKLMASMANNMSKLAGGTSLTENDFTGAWNVPALGIEIATDPGILGGALSRHLAPSVKLYDTAGDFIEAPLQKAAQSNKISSKEILDMLSKETNIKSAVGEAGQLMSNFDDVLAKMSWDMTAPGLRPGIRKLIDRIDTILPADRYNPYVNEILKQQEEAELLDETKSITESLDTVSRKDVSKPITKIPTEKITKEYLNNNADITYLIHQLTDVKNKLKMLPNTPENVKNLKEVNSFLTELGHIRKGNQIAGIVEDYKSKTLSNFGEKDFSKSAKEIAQEYQNTRLKNYEYSINDIYKETLAQEGKSIPKIAPKTEDLIEAFNEKRKMILGTDYVGSDDIHIKKLDEELSKYLDVDDDTIISTLRAEASNPNLPVSKEDISKYRLENIERKLNDGSQESQWITSFVDKEFKNKIPNSPVIIKAKNFANKLDVLYNTPILDESNKRMLKIVKDYQLPNSISKDFVQGKFYNIDKELRKIYPQYDAAVKEWNSSVLHKGYKEISNPKERWLQNFNNFYDHVKEVVEKSPVEGDLDLFLEDLKEIHSTLNSIEIGQADSYLQMYSQGLNAFFKDQRKEGYNIFTKIVNGKPTFNYDLYYRLKNELPIFDVILNEDILKSTYGISIADVNKYISENYPPLGNSLPDFEMWIGKGKTTPASIEYLLNATHGKGNLLVSGNAYKSYVNLAENKEKFTNHLIEVNEMIKEAAPEDVANLLEESTTINPNVDKAIDAVAAVSGETPKEIAKVMENIKHYDGPNEAVPRYFSKLDTITNNVYVKNTNKNTYASVRYVKSKLQRMEDVKAGVINFFKATNPKLSEKELNKLWLDKCSEYLTLRDKALGDIVTKDKFVREFIDAKGIFVGRAKIGEVGNLQKAIEHNARVLNKNAQLVIPFSQQIGDYMYVGLKLNTAEKDIINLFNKHVKIDGMEDLQDIIFAFKDNTVDLGGFKNMHSAMNDVNESASNLYKTMGFKDATIDYTKHKYRFTDAGEEALGKLYKQLGIDNIKEIRQCGSTLQEMYNKHGAFMTFNTAKSLRGNIADWNELGPIFENDLTKIAKSTFTDGIFDNQKVQTFIDLCLSDNTKVSSWATDWQDLKRLINAKDAYGKPSGNLKNMTLASAIYDEETGAFLRFKKYDMLTDKGIQEAFENNAFYVPTNMFAMLDKMVKKDAKMSNKLYAFMNKYLVLPFKFGTLANPGFLVGNFSDAYMKQALTLSQKYGTSVAEEFANVSESISDIVHLNNNFDEIYRNKFLVSIGEKAVKENPYLKISSKVFDDPKVSEKFLTWYKANRDLLPKLETDNVDLMLYINRYIPTMTGNLTAFDLEDVAKYGKGQKFELPKSKLEKLMMGNHYDPHNITTWGLFAGNPISSTVMRYSGDIETLFRSASVLNDLKHYYKNTDNLIKTIGLDPEEFAKRHQELSAKTLDAINLMNAANFNYDNISDFMQKVSYTMPFPTFYLKNIGYWLEVLEEHPEYIDTIVNIQNTMWHGIDTTKDNFQAEAKGRGSLPMSSIIGQNPSKVFKGVLKPTMTNSMFSAFSTINNPVKDIANRVNPTMSNLTRHLQDPENVRYRPYSTDLYEKNIKQGDKNFNSLTYTFHRLNPYDRFLNTYLRTPNKIKTNQAQMSDFLPSIFQPDYSRKEKPKK